MIVRNNKKVDLRKVGLILTLLAVVGGVSGGCKGNTGDTGEEAPDTEGDGEETTPPAGADANGGDNNTEGDSEETKEKSDGEG